MKIEPGAQVAEQWLRQKWRSRDLHAGQAAQAAGRVRDNALWLHIEHGLARFSILRAQPTSACGWTMSPRTNDAAGLCRGDAHTAQFQHLEGLMPAGI